MDSRYLRLGLVGICLCVLAVFLAAQFYYRNVAYAVYLDDRLIGLVQSRAELEERLEAVRLAAASEGYLPQGFSFDVKVEKLNGFKPFAYSSYDEVVAAITEKAMPYVSGVAIVVNGTKAAVVSDRQVAAEAIAAVQAAYLSSVESSIKSKWSSVERIEILSVKVNERVEFVPGRFSPDKLVDKDQAVQLLLKGSDQVLVHKVKPGESLWTIAAEHKLALEDLYKANPELSPTSVLQIGQEIDLVVPKPAITFSSVERVTYIEKIPFETRIVYDSGLWPWERVVRQEGKYGQKQIVLEIARSDGKVLSSTVVSEKLISEPRAMTVAQGRKLIASRGTGRFIWPVEGQITSGFGRRWGRMHTGVDIAAPVGTPVVAADSGIVVEAGRRGGYGLTVVIDHGGGIQTLYAHNSSIMVSVGQQVAKGDVISRLGATGQTTGPNLHFEVLINGTPVDPIKFYQQQGR